MRKWLLLSVALSFLLFPVSAWAQNPGAGLAGSEHDFSGFPAGTGAVVTGLCTFCHTPHKAVQTRLLWNHTLSQNTFAWSDATSTVGGTRLPTVSTAWTGPTKLCLSCHDGSVAVGDIQWFNERAWTGASALDPTKYSSGPFNTATPGGDLKGNHPVAFPYPYNGAPNTYNGTTTGNRVELLEFVSDPTTLKIRLFNDSSGGVEAGPIAGHTGMECSTCHDPHNGTAVQAEFFLRGTLGGSDANYICLKCHKK